MATKKGQAKTSEFYYLTEDAREKLKTYSYHGNDTSLLYKYVLSPLAAFLVETIIPKTMAPNIVTSIGLAWMIAAYLTYWWYVPDLEAIPQDENSESFYPPRWIFLFNGIAILVYQTLDNMDGKQARRTGSGSPLGLLFDHGCDAINSIFGSANVIIGMNLSPHEDLLNVWLLVFMPFLVFYVATWEQYLTGELILPIINGPSEGLLGTATLSFVSFWKGTQYWHQTDIFDSLLSVSSMQVDWKLRNCDLIALAVTLCTVQEVLFKSYDVIRNGKGSLEALIPMFALGFCFFSIGYEDPNIWLDIPRTSLHLACFLFVEMSTELMLAHTTAQKFVAMRWQPVPLILITFWVEFFGNTEGLQSVIMAYTAFMGAYLVMKFRCVIREICNVLGIWCFDIVTPYYSAQKRKD